MIEKGLKYSVSELDQNINAKNTLGTTESNRIYFTDGETEAKIGQVEKVMVRFFFLGAGDHGTNEAGSA